MATISDKKRVSVTFAGDDDVIQHIVPITERRTSLRPRKRAATPLKAKKVESESEPEDEKTNEDEVFRPSEALVDDSELAGSDVYGFKSNKRTGQMAQKASESVQAVTPKSALKSMLKKSSLRGSVGTPKGKPRKVEATTPFRLRRRNQNEEGEDDSSNESMSSSGSDDDNDDVENKTPRTPRTPKTSKGRNATPVTPSRTPKGTPSSRATPKGKGTPATKRRRRLLDDEHVPDPATDNYFDAQHEAAVTSDRTLARLETPRMDQEALTQALRGVEVSYPKERAALYQEHRQHLDKWMFFVCNGYNLLLHGLGSKRQLLEDFRTTFLTELDHLVINGFFPSLTIKSVLNAITEDVLEHRGSFRSPVEQVDYIRKHYEGGEYADLFLIVHNIDGAMLRSEKAQSVLSLLAQIRGVHFIASIDHINASLVWDQTKASRFNWLWYDVTTYAAYTEETSYENSLLVQQSGTLALSSLTHVMRSLTPNARGIFLLLVQHQRDNRDNPNYLGLAFPDLYQRCREAFLVNSDQTLRTQLTEFRDHKLIRTKKGVDGMEYLIIPLDDSTLQEFVEQQENDG